MTTSLVTAIQAITDDYDTPEGEIADPIAVVLETRTTLDHKEVDHCWQLEPEVVAAYHAVLDATNAELAVALRELITN